MRRAEPGDRRAPGPAAALPAAAASSGRCAPTSCTRTPRCGPGGPGCCSSGWPRRLRLSPPGPRADPSGWCASCSPGARASRRLVELVHQRSGGVPLHVEELVNAAAQGHLSADPSYVPETLAEAIQQRFDGAVGGGPGQRGGRGRRTPQLRPRPARRGRGHARTRTPPTSLDELVDRHFVHEESPGWFGFRHALIRDAIEANAPLATRRALHARVAEVARHRPELGGDAYRSAHHEAAGQLDEAVGRGRGRGASGPARCPRTRRRSTCCTGRCGACARATTGAGSTCSPAGPPRPPPPTTTRQAAADFERGARPAPRGSGDPVAAAALLPGLVAARHLLGDPLPARIALLEQGPRGGRPVGRRAGAAAGPGRPAGGEGRGVPRRRPPRRRHRGGRAGARGRGRPGRADPAQHGGHPGHRSWCSPGGMDEGWRRLEQATRRARELGLEAEAARGYRMIGSSASTLVEYDRAEHWLRRGHRVRRPDRAVEPPPLHGQPPGPRLVVPGPLGRGRPGGAAGAHRGRGRHHHPDHRAARRRLRRAGPRAASSRPAEPWARRAPSGEEMGELQRFSPALWGLAECALLPAGPRRRRSP